MRLSDYVCLSDTNQRENNQDSYLVVEFTPFGASTSLLLLAVADGIGGFEHGAEVSREALGQIGLSLFKQLTIEPSLNTASATSTFGLTHLANALSEAAAVVDSYVKRLVETNHWDNAGTTVVMAAIFEGETVVFNLGDSPLFHYERSASTLSQLSEDHTVAETLVRCGLITPQMARYHEGNSQLEFYLGGGVMPAQPPVQYRKLNDGDLLLLCTDGISRLLSLERMNEVMCRMEGVLESSHGLANLAEALREEALSVGEVDNQTLIIWRYSADSVSSPD
jgi:serine/threonine protein phosphatase PrpC